MVECSFPYQLTQVVPDKGPFNSCACVRVHRSSSSGSILPVFAEPIQLVLVESDGVFALPNADPDVVGCSVVNVLHQFVPAFQRKYVLPRNSKIQREMCSDRQSCGFTSHSI